MFIHSFVFSWLIVFVRVNSWEFVADRSGFKRIEFITVSACHAPGAFSLWMSEAVPLAEGGFPEKCPHWSGEDE